MLQPTKHVLSIDTDVDGSFCSQQQGLALAVSTRCFEIRIQSDCCKKVVHSRFSFETYCACKVCQIVVAQEVIAKQGRTLERCSCDCSHAYCFCYCGQQRLGMTIVGNLTCPLAKKASLS